MNFSKWFTSTITSVINSIPADYKNMVDAEDKGHFQSFN